MGKEILPASSGPVLSTSSEVNQLKLFSSRCPFIERMLFLELLNFGFWAPLMLSPAKRSKRRRQEKHKKPDESKKKPEELNLQMAQKLSNEGKRDNKADLE